MDKDEKQAEKRERRMRRAARVNRFLDPAAASNQTSVLDAYGGTAGNLRTAERENKQLRTLEALLTEQQETNRLLRQLLERG